MRYTAPLLVAVAVLGSGSCGRTLPESYGIYANTNRGMTRLAAQKAQLRGNILQAYAGLEGPSGFECSGFKSFVVYKKNVRPEDLKVTQLEYQSTVRVSSLFGSSAVDMKLWVPSQPIEVDIKPVEGKSDMYFVEPKQRLGNGFYALYMGAFGTLFGNEENFVYDLVVGKSKDYPSYQARAGTNTRNVQREADRLLKEINDVFNRRDYSKLADIYRPSGTPLSGPELDQFVSGMQTWRTQSGKILSSKIVHGTVGPGGNSGAFELETIYEQAGNQKEKMEVTKHGDRWYITSLK